jgi:hypothetical protein
MNAGEHHNPRNRQEFIDCPRAIVKRIRPEHGRIFIVVCIELPTVILTHVPPSF